MAEKMRSLSETLSAAGPALLPEQPVIGRHDYIPSPTHMGDCNVCGNVQSAEIHQRSEPKQPNMSEVIADRFIQYGEVGALALEELGDAAVVEAKMFKDEMYRNAKLLRKKAQDKAMDTSWFIQQMRAFHDLAKEEPRLKAQVAPASVANSDGVSDSPDTGDGANHPVLPDGAGHKSEV